jgi:hypothetical protein
MRGNALVHIIVLSRALEPPTMQVIPVESHTPLLHSRQKLFFCFKLFVRAVTRSKLFDCTAGVQMRNVEPHQKSHHT